MNKNNRILVTGYKGQLGFDVVKELKNQSYQNVLGIDKDDLDITDEKKVNEFIKEYHPSIVIHCAAYTSVDKAEIESETAFKVNSYATKYIAQQVLDYLFINKDVITSIFKSNYSPRLNDMMSSFFKKSIIEFMEHYPEEFGRNDPTIKDLLVSFVAGGCSYLLVCFFTSGAHLEKEKVMMTTIDIMNKVFSLAKEKLLA